MQADLIRIGNSQGIRIPKVILEQCGFGKSVEIIVEGNCLIIKPISATRAGWDDAFREMSVAGDDAPLVPESLANDFDESDWTW
jgi:antitoxin MazE